MGDGRCMDIDHQRAGLAEDAAGASADPADPVIHLQAQGSACSDRCSGTRHNDLGQCSAKIISNILSLLTPGYCVPAAVAIHSRSHLELIQSHCQSFVGHFPHLAGSQPAVGHNYRSNFDTHYADSRTSGTTRSRLVPRTARLDVIGWAVGLGWKSYRRREGFAMPAGRRGHMASEEEPWSRPDHSDQTDCKLALPAHLLGHLLD